MRRLSPQRFRMDRQFQTMNNHEFDQAQMEESSQEEASTLLTLVQQYDWAGTLARLAAHPDEARSVDGEEGRTVLHIACDHDAPAVVVQALIKAYPEASIKGGTSSMNPLHVACSSQHASVHVVKVLLEDGYGVEAKMCDVDGDTPLHAACRSGAPIEVIEVLLRAYPDAVNRRDLEGLTPLLRLWVKYFVILGDDVIDAIKGPADLTGELGEAWRKTELLLKSAHHGTLDLSEHETFRAVHAASSVDCPRAVVKIATIVHPDQIELVDEEMRTPLMLASMAPIYKVRDLSDNGYMLEDIVHEGTEEQSEGGNDLDESETQGTSQPPVIDILMSASTEPACISDRSGRLPLHMAIHSGKKWSNGVKSILEAYPDALLRRDPVTALYPFMAAALDRCDPLKVESTQSDLTTLFELLRTNPSVVQSALGTPLRGVPFTPKRIR